MCCLQTSSADVQQVVGDVQPLPAEAAEGAGGKADEKADPKKASKVVNENPEEMNFFEKLALKVARMTGTVAVEAVFQQKVRGHQ